MFRASFRKNNYESPIQKNEGISSHGGTWLPQISGLTLTYTNSNNNYGREDERKGFPNEHW